MFPPIGGNDDEGRDQPYDQRGNGDQAGDGGAARAHARGGGEGEHGRNGDAQAQFQRGQVCDPRWERRRRGGGEQSAGPRRQREKEARAITSAVSSSWGLNQAVGASPSSYDIGTAPSPPPGAGAGRSSLLEEERRGWIDARSRGRRFWHLVIGASFSLWSAAFILSTSVRVQGRRYFCLFDDAMISMRYGWNLGHGHGLVWNPGERIEGITNLLMAVVMAVPAALLEKSGAVLAVQISGAVVLLAGAAVYGRLVGGLLSSLLDGEEAEFARILAFTATLSYYPLVAWTLLGMETGLLALLMGLGAGLVLVGSASRSRPWLGLVLGLAYATRPDSLLPALALLAADLARSRGDRRALRTTLGDAALLGASVVGLALFRWTYYGDIVPNTYALKVAGFPLTVRLHDGLVYSVAYMAQSWPLLLLAAGGALAVRGAGPWLFGSAACAIAYQAWAGGDAWYYWRLMAPYTPLLLVLAVAGAVAAARRLGGHLRLSPAGVRTTAVLLTALPLVWADWPFRDEVALREPPSLTLFNRRHVVTALALLEIARPSATVGVFSAGVVPYYSGLRGVDFLGKNDRHIARVPPDLAMDIPGKLPGLRTVAGHNRYDLHYAIVERAPDYIEGSRWGHDDLSAYAAEHYVLRAGLLLRKESPHIDWSRLP